jgi:hypothetical protein
MDKTQKTKKIKRINFVDWILIAIALAAIVSFVYFAFFSELNLFGNARSDVTVQYTLRVEKLNTDLLMLNIQDDEGILNADFLSDGDKVYDSVSGKQIGRIASIKYVRSTEKTGKVAAIRMVEDGEDLLLVTSGGIIMRTQIEEISTLSRVTQGVRVVRLDEGVKVIDIAGADREEEELPTEEAVEE